ncbi:MAG: hypothetical protein K2W96_27610, partial [Gemmataceae bacterium]|nr:hypothetical protein [Gemmataceae bacterium]
MPAPVPVPTAVGLQVRRLRGLTLDLCQTALEEYFQRRETWPLSQHPRWLSILQDGLGHDVCALEAVRDGRTVGFLPLAYVSSFLFGRFLASLPYLNT